MKKSAFVVVSTLLSLLMVTAQTPPPPPNLVSPANGVFQVPAHPTSFQWQGLGTSYRLQVATDPNFLSVAFDRANIPQPYYSSGLLDSVLYYWRVNASDTNGTSNWSSVWSFTTTISHPTLTPPPPPVLISPSNGETGVWPICCKNLLPNFVWRRSPGAKTYEVRISNDPNFILYAHEMRVVNNDPDTLSQIGILWGGTFYWKARAANEAGSGNWSQIYSFEVIPPSPDILWSPDWNAKNVPLNTLFSWRASGASSYRLKVGKSVTKVPSPHSSPVSQWEDVTETIIDVSVPNNGTETVGYFVTGLAQNTRYYWRPDPEYQGGPGFVLRSSASSFTTIVTGPPATPTLASPGNGATDVSTSPTLSWNGASGASSYQLQVATNTGFSALVLDQNGVTETSRGLSGLANSTTYYWRVRAVNDSGASAYSSVWNFTTSSPPPPPPDPPPAPILISPANGTSDVPVNPTLSWSTSARATSYRLQVATNTSFSALVFNQSGITGTSHSLSGLVQNTTYYWRVAAQNADGDSPWSLVWSFTTFVPPPDLPTAPALIFPTSTMMSMPTTFTFQWGFALRADSYHIQVLNGPDFSNKVLDDSGLTITSRKVSGLDYGKIYHWQVRAKNTSGVSEWNESSFAIRKQLTIAGFLAIAGLTDGSPIFKQSLVNPPLFTGNIGPLTFKAMSSDTTSCLTWISSDTVFVSFAKPRKTGKATVTIVGQDIDSTTVYYTTPILRFITAVEDEKVPAAFSLSQNYPNPFNPSTTIEFSLPKAGLVTLKVVSILGQEIETLIDGEMDVGTHRARWKADQYPGGMYFYQLKVGAFTETKKMLLVK